MLKYAEIVIADGKQMDIFRNKIFKGNKVSEWNAIDFGHKAVERTIAVRAV